MQGVLCCLRSFSFSFYKALKSIRQPTIHVIPAVVHPSHIRQQVIQRKARYGGRVSLLLCRVSTCNEQLARMFARVWVCVYVWMCVFVRACKCVTAIQARGKKTKCDMMSHKCSKNETRIWMSHWSKAQIRLNFGKPRQIHHQGLAYLPVSPSIQLHWHPHYHH